MNKSASFTISLLLHAVIFLLLIKNPIDLKIVNDSDIPIEVLIVDNQDSKQIVSQKYKNQLIPENSKYFGKQNQKVEKEQINRSRKNLNLSDLMPKYEFGQGSKQPTQEQSDSSEISDKSVASGAQTVLNSHEFKYFSYYERIRNQLASYWYSDIRNRLRRLEQEGHVLKINRATKTIVTLNKDGDLINVQIIGPSGLKDLDESTLRAFQSASPFPNPPKELVKQGVITISWNFLLELD